MKLRDCYLYVWWRTPEIDPGRPLLYCRRFLFSIPCSYRLPGVTYAELPNFMLPELLGLLNQTKQ